MRNEKIVALSIVIAIIVVLSTLIIFTNENIFRNLFPEEKKPLEIGDCVEVHYIGRYASNGTIFDSSYSDYENKTGGTPLKLYLSLTHEDPPQGYEEYTSDFITGFIEGLVGLREKETKNITVPPEKGYGAKRIEIGDKFNTTHLFVSQLHNFTINQTVEVINLTENDITLKWLNVNALSNFTSPEGVLVEKIKDFEEVYSTGFYNPLPPYYIWENSSNVINVTNTHILIKTTPTKTTNLTDQILFFSVGDEPGVVFPNATTAEWNETHVILHSLPQIGSEYKYEYKLDEMSLILNITVENVTETSINLGIEFEGSVESYEVNRTIEFNRTYLIPRIYVMSLEVAEYIFSEDIKNAGASLNKLAGEELVFEVTIEKVHKIS